MTATAQWRDDGAFLGYSENECGGRLDDSHRTCGGRAWCLNCSEWCSPNLPCNGCELPVLREAASLLAAVVNRTWGEGWSKAAHAVVERLGL